MAGNSTRLGLRAGSIGRNDHRFLSRTHSQLPDSAPAKLVYGVTASDWNDARNEPHGAYSLMTWADVMRCRVIRPDAAGWMTKQYLEGRLARASAVFRYRNGIRLWAAVQADAVWPGCSPETVKEARDQAAYGEAIRTGSGYAPASWFVNRRYDLS